MKLKYKMTPPSEAGSALPGCGTIHRSEIKATLTKLSDDLLSPFDFNDVILGSTGKVEYSGDIDVVVDTGWGMGIPAFRERLEMAFNEENVARNGSMVHLKYPIVSYKEELQEVLPRTGYVQIDFNFGNTDWEKFYHFSPGEDSEYKGAHRNLAIAAVSAVVGANHSDEKDAQGRSVKVTRYIFGPEGFKKIERHSRKDLRSGNWLKKQEDILLAGPYFDPDTIARLLFDNKSANASDLFSLETILAAVDKYCGLVEKERIYKRMAHNFHDWNYGKYFLYPDEISKYFDVDDK